LKKNEPKWGNLWKNEPKWGSLGKNEPNWGTAGNGKQMKKHTDNVARNVAILPTCRNMANVRFDVHHFPGECSILRRPHVHTFTHVLRCPCTHKAIQSDAPFVCLPKVMPPSDLQKALRKFLAKLALCSPPRLHRRRLKTIRRSSNSGFPRCCLGTFGGEVASSRARSNPGVPSSGQGCR